MDKCKCGSIDFNITKTEIYNATVEEGRLKAYHLDEDYIELITCIKCLSSYSDSDFKSICLD